MKPSGPHRRANPTADNNTAVKTLTVCVWERVYSLTSVLIKIEVKGSVFLTLQDSILSVRLLSGGVSTPLTSWITWAHKHVTHTWILHTHTLNILYAALNTIIKLLVLLEMGQKNICFQICLHFFEQLIFGLWLFRGCQWMNYPGK